jgi:hypothetical protein
VANAQGTIVAGDFVSYLEPTFVRWRAAKVMSVTTQSLLVLAYVSINGARATINGSVAVAKRTNGTQTNVWRRF